MTNCGRYSKESTTLYDALKRGKMNKTQGRTLAQKLISGVQQLHTKEIIHMDIKDDNVLLLNDTHPVIIDLGKATFIRDAKPLKVRDSEKPKWLKLYKWIDPELISTNVTPSTMSDMYSLGFLLKCISWNTSDEPLGGIAAGMMLQVSQRWKMTRVLANLNWLKSE